MLCFALLCPAFFITANAEEVDTSLIKVTAGLAHYNPTVANWSTRFNVMDGGTGGWEAVQRSLTLYESSYLLASFVVQNSDGSILFPADKLTRFTLSNFVNVFIVNGYQINSSPTYAYYRVYYTDSSYENIEIPLDDVEYQYASDTFNINLELTPAVDVDRIVIYLRNDYYNSDDIPSGLGSTVVMESYYGWLYDYLTLRVDIQTEEAGLLSGLLGKITELWQVCSSGFANIVKSLTELPQKLWDLIENGLKSLFVPDSDFLLQYKANLSDLMSDRLGAVWQVVDLLLNSWDSILASGETGSIEFPLVTIPVGDGHTFSFGGYDVDLVPDGFEWLQTSVRLATSIGCSIIFINGLRRRYDEVFGGGNS